MTFSETVSQQRAKQEKLLKRFVTYSLTGSFALHGVGLCLKVNNLWKPDRAEPEEIAIVVMEQPEEALTEETPLDETFSEPEATSEFIESDATPGEAGAATFVESPPAAALPEPSVEEDPIVEPEPEPSPAPIAEDVEEPVTEEPVTEEPVTEESADPPLAESSEEVAEVPQPRTLNNLLEELRRAREQTRQTAANREAESQVESSNRTNTAGTASEESDRATRTAVRSDRPGSSPSSSSSPGSSESESTRPGNGEGDRPNPGRGSREISCRNCNFDYPESANGAEGTAQVIVETDERGRVVSVTLSGSSGNPELDRAALQQARERVRLDGATAGESYPIEIDFVQPNSEAAERVRERGDRRSITVSDPEPTTAESSEPETPETVANPSAPEPSVPAEPSASPEAESSPSSPVDSESPDNVDGLEEPAPDIPLPSEPSNSPEAAPAPAPAPEAAPAPAPIPEAAPAPAPAPAPIPEAAPAPAPAPAPVPAPAPAPAPLPLPDPVSAPPE
ncbi:TonB family protein [Oculatella sp. LEGE 06141]|uniref:TonB family protein n=1 Tax=Oculatella sp. LEGE 06141 TaxID=1828648 RepID=UPI001882ECB1|nr:TonB family protein [Oculatella sp. LEGE 06141]MBE9182842.1 TonB family protein [Oculatella sp. LEGE 06141]